MIIFNLTVDVPPLSDKTVWFANAQAWNNYWQSVTAEATLDPIATSIYAPVNYVASDACVQEIDGVQFYLATQAGVDSLAAKVAAIDTALQAFRQELKDAGLITEAQ